MKILTHYAHATYQTNLSRIPDTEYYHIIDGAHSPKFWDDTAALPANIHPISQQEARESLKDFDVMIIHAHSLLGYYKDWQGIKKIFVEHTGPYNRGGQQQRFWGGVRKQTANLTVFITETNKQAWLPVDDGSKNIVIRHAMDVDAFPQWDPKKSTDIVMTTVNALVARDWCCGLSVWGHIAWRFPSVHIYGFGNETLGSQYAKGSVDRETLLQKLTEAGVYFNPSLVSPIPMSLLEAMSAGVPIATTAYYEPGIVFTDGVHGIVTNSVIELADGIKKLLENKELAYKLGQAGRERVRELFTVSGFADGWLNAFSMI